MPSSSLRPQRPPITPIGRLADAIGATVHGGGDGSVTELSVTGVELRAQDVLPGDLFAALPGARHHGARFAADAVARGAVAVLTDPEGADLVATTTAGSDVVVLVHSNPRSVLGSVSATVYGDPSASMTVVGITGTSGKTTTSYLVEAALRAGGRTPGLIGTVETRIGDTPVPSALTTPEAPHLHALFAAMLEQGCDSVVMEVSSHALSLGRVDGTRFAVGAFTNLSQDHLDFHHTFEEYFAAKARLFAADSDVHAAESVVCVDDEWGRRMADIAAASGPVTTVSTGGETDGASAVARDWRVRADGTQTFRAVLGDHDVAATLRLPGRYNVANALVAAAVAVRVGVDPQVAMDAMATVDVPGRMQRVDRGQPFLALVDYAHKPAALEVALATLRRQSTGRVAVVVGAGGDRDTEKRPLMGAVSAAAADLVVITDDNPRSEDPALIRAAVRTGAMGVADDVRGEVVEISPRADAVAYAVRWARPGDVVLVAGKGHEVGQKVGDVVHPFDDREALARAIDGLATVGPSIDERGEDQRS
ncbi:UDP-N-acetylmuramoyl-L-alanyl-D-glutamate--2,6-diaminopimelate ligase [Rhodococcoides corynebacterioides]|uniref:UDP-N-acetylmuramoyl-L-alanyl-D-glutamate--2, 6-diaminopimelate ligase n=1 Tax=Rhodococcoides corynebacterioides TaxID=53972 RepID=UPI003F81DB5F